MTLLSQGINILYDQEFIKFIVSIYQVNCFDFKLATDDETAQTSSAAERIPKSSSTQDDLVFIELIESFL